MKASISFRVKQEGRKVRCSRGSVVVRVVWGGCECVELSGACKCGRGNVVVGVDRVSRVSRVVGVVEVVRVARVVRVVKVVRVVAVRRVIYISER